MKKSYDIFIKNIVVIEDSGEDTISFEIEGSTTHPEVGYTPRGKIMTRKGYGVKWLSEMFDIEPEDIKVIRVPSSF